MYMYDTLVPVSNFDTPDITVVKTLWYWLMTSLETQHCCMFETVYVYWDIKMLPMSLKYIIVV